MLICKEKSPAFWWR